jgi:hypothetical protein
MSVAIKRESGRFRRLRSRPPPWARALAGTAQRAKAAVGLDSFSALPPAGVADLSERNA